MGLSLLFGNFCLAIVSKFTITGLILFSLVQFGSVYIKIFCAACRQKLVTKYLITKLNLQIETNFFYQILSRFDAVHAVDTNQRLQGKPCTGDIRQNDLAVQIKDVNSS